MRRDRCRQQRPPPGAAPSLQDDHAGRRITQRGLEAIGGFGRHDQLGECRGRGVIDPREVCERAIERDCSERELDDTLGHPRSPLAERRVDIGRIDEQQPESAQPTVVRELRDADRRRVGIDDGQEGADGHGRSVGEVCQQPAQARIDLERDEGREDGDLGRREREAIAQEVQWIVRGLVRNRRCGVRQRLRIASEPAFGAPAHDRSRNAHGDVEASGARDHRRHGLPVRRASISSARSAENVSDLGSSRRGRSQVVGFSMQIFTIGFSRSSMLSQ